MIIAARPTEPASHGAPQKCSNKPGHLISEEIYIFLLSGNEQILINVKTAISDLAARFLRLILFAPRHTGNESVGLPEPLYLPILRSQTAFPPAPSPVNSKLLWAGDWQIPRLECSTPTWISGQLPGALLGQGERLAGG